MLSQSHGCVYLTISVCLTILFLLLGYRDFGLSFHALPFSHHFSQTTSIPKAIANSTLGFEKIFVINAPWRSDRKDSISLAASYTGITLDWIDGVDAETIREKAYPPGNHRDLPHGNLGSWRAHMDALRTVVERNLSTALILEDDADWDFRLRSQLSSFGLAARHLPSLLATTDLASKDSKSPEEELDPIELAKRSSLPLSSLPRPKLRTDEPYGRDWDVLWLGHCGAFLPPASPRNPDRIAQFHDPTAPQPQHLKPMANADIDKVARLYPPHTRVIHRANSTLCTIAYAVSQKAARKLLYEFGIREFDRGFDFGLSDWCNGKLRGGVREWGLPMCLTVQPPIFSHHFSEKGTSDITGSGAGGKPQVGTRYVRWSVKMNLERLVRGEEGMVEQWGDEEGEDGG